MARLPKKPIKEIDPEADAWRRFAKSIDVVIKAAPLRRPAKGTKAKRETRERGQGEVQAKGR